METPVNIPEDANSRQKQLVRELKGIRVVLTLLLILLLIEFVRVRIGTLSIVDGNSMYPTFKSLDVIKGRVTYTTPARGDIVIINDNLGGNALKRVIGLPGEEVALYHGFVYIDRVRLDEHLYLPPNTYTYPSDRQAVFRLGPNDFFVLGDNRQESCDSRNYGPITRGQIHSIVATDQSVGFNNIMLPRHGEALPHRFGRAPVEWMGSPTQSQSPR